MGSVGGSSGVRVSTAEVNLTRESQSPLKERQKKRDEPGAEGEYKRAVRQLGNQKEVGGT